MYIKEDRSNVPLNHSLSKLTMGGARNARCVKCWQHAMRTWLLEPGMQGGNNERHRRRSRAEFSHY